GAGGIGKLGTDGILHGGGVFRGDRGGELLVQMLLDSTGFRGAIDQKGVFVASAGEEKNQHRERGHHADEDGDGEEDLHQGEAATSLAWVDGDFHGTARTKVRDSECCLPWKE